MALSPGMRLGADEIVAPLEKAPECRALVMELVEGDDRSVVLMLVGIGVIGLFTATVSGYMFSSEEGGVSNAELAERLDRIERLLAQMQSSASRESEATLPDQATQKELR
jgi:hypothetical protein